MGPWLTPTEIFELHFYCVFLEVKAGEVRLSHCTALFHSVVLHFVRATEHCLTRPSGL